MTRRALAIGLATILVAAACGGSSDSCDAIADDGAPIAALFARGQTDALRDAGEGLADVVARFAEQDCDINAISPGALADFISDQGFTEEEEQVFPFALLSVLDGSLLEALEDG